MALAPSLIPDSGLERAARRNSADPIGRRARRSEGPARPNDPRARRLTGLAHVRDSEVEIAKRIGHEKEIGRVRLAWPHRQNLAAHHLRFVRLPLAHPARARSTVSAMLNGGAAFGLGGLVMGS